jgi:hypothetical protein
VAKQVARELPAVEEMEAGVAHALMAALRQAESAPSRESAEAVKALAAAWVTVRGVARPSTRVPYGQTWQSQVR